MLPFLAGAVSEESPSAPGREAFRFTDPDIVESSGLVAQRRARRHDQRLRRLRPGLHRRRADRQHRRCHDLAVGPGGRRGARARRAGARLGRRHRRQPGRPRLGRGAPGAGRPRGRRGRRDGVRARLSRRGARRRGAREPPALGAALRGHQGHLRGHGVRRPAAAARPTDPTPWWRSARRRDWSPTPRSCPVAAGS